MKARWAGPTAHASRAQHRRCLDAAARAGALVPKLGLVELRDPSTGGSVWFSRAALCPAPEARSAATTAGADTAPTGNLKLLCQLAGGRAYVFVVDEARQTVAARDSGGQAWVTFRDGQVTRQRLGDQTIAMVDTVRVDAASIRALRVPRDDVGGPGKGGGSANELMGALGSLLVMAGTSSSVAIDRNSAAIRTGGSGLFPNNAVGACEPWTGRRF